MLDQFISTEFIKKYIYSLYKFNLEVIEIEVTNDKRNCFGVDPFSFAKEAGKYRNLGEYQIFSYIDLIERVKVNYKSILAVQKKKEEAQKAYEENKTNLQEVKEY